MTRTLAVIGLVLGMMALPGCTAIENSVTSGWQGPSSPAMSGNYGAGTNLAPPYGPVNTAEPDLAQKGDQRESGNDQRK